MYLSSPFSVPEGTGAHTLAGRAGHLQCATGGTKVEGDSQINGLIQHGRCLEDIERGRYWTPEALHSDLEPGCLGKWQSEQRAKRTYPEIQRLQGFRSGWPTRVSRSAVRSRLSARCRRGRIWVCPGLCYPRELVKKRALVRRGKLVEKVEGERG